MVEDDDGVRAVNADLLRELGYTVIEAAGPQPRSPRWTPTPASRCC